MAQSTPPPPQNYPPPPTVPPPVQEIYPAPGRPGCRGCGWGVAGAFGCLVVLLIPLVILVMAGSVTVNGLISNVQNMLNAPPVITAQIVLERVQALAQLTTVRYNYSSLVTSEREMPGVLAVLYGERQVMVAVGHVNAGVNLDELTAADITRDGNAITIHLPPPVLHDCFLNEQASYVVSRDTGVFARSAPNLDSDARRFAVQQFRDNALEEGILTEVQQQAQAVIEQFFSITRLEDGSQVHVVVSAPVPDAPLPESCQ